MSKQTIKRCLSILVMAAGVAADLTGQSSRGTVSGLVTDPSGAMVPGASVDLRNTETGVVRSSRTNDSGLYRFDAVDLGTYQVAVNSPGFRSLQTNRFVVAAGQAASVDARSKLANRRTSLR